MPLKPGGGNRPELYDPKNGRYVADEEFKKSSHELELSNVVARVVFKDYNPDSTLFTPRYPIFGYHSDLYNRMYVVDQVRGKPIFIRDNKVKDYLLKHNEINDKSHFFEIHGYSRDNYIELRDAIINGTDSSRAKYNKMTHYGLFVEMQTKIYSRKEKDYIKIITIWKVDEKTLNLNFITVNLDKKRI